MRHSHWSKTALRLLAASGLAACSPIEPIPDPIAFEFQSSASGSAILVSFRNTGDDVVFLPRCGDRVLPAIDRSSGGTWVNAAAAICQTNLRMDPIALDVGAVLQDSVPVMQPGTYRLRLVIERGGTAATPETIVSPSFAIE